MEGEGRGMRGEESQEKGERWQDVEECTEKLHEGIDTLARSLIAKDSEFGICEAESRASEFT